MEFIRAYIGKLIAMLEIDGYWSNMFTVAVMAVLLVVADLILCIVASAVIKRILLRHSDGIKHREKTITALRRITRFVFVWILCEWMPDIISYYPLESFERLLDAITVAFGATALTSVATWLQSAAHIRTGDKRFSSKTFAQVATIVIWFTAVIIIISALMGKSPTFILSGLGALTAVLMLIFKDSILGLVAGVQVAQNDMVRIGDWITMPKYNADGNVIDIALTTIKVQNFDNTVTMIPSSALISDSFINWRYMSVSKGRRIKRPVWISASSIKPVSDKMYEKLTSKGLLGKDDKPVSNLEAFEIWLRRMLKNNDKITKELTCMVRQTDAGAQGIPVELYCFTKTRDWEEYEYIQTEIFDLIFVTVSEFGLEIYERTRSFSETGN